MDFGDLIWVGLILYGILSGLAQSRKKKQRQASQSGAEPAQAQAQGGILGQLQRQIEQAAERAEQERARQARLRFEAERAARGGPADPRFEVHDVTPDQVRPARTERTLPSGRPVDRAGETLPVAFEPTSPARIREPRPALPVERGPARPRKRPRDPVPAPRGSDGLARLSGHSRAPSPPGRPRPPSGPAAGPAALERFERYAPLRRAILFSEILGPPKALQDEP